MVDVHNVDVMDKETILNWESGGININGVHLNHLRFADDIAILSQSDEELEKMLTYLALTSNTIGLQMNYRRTKIMFNTQRQFDINQQTIENVEEY